MERPRHTPRVPRFCLGTHVYEALPHVNIPREVQPRGSVFPGGAWELERTDTLEVFPLLTLASPDSNRLTPRACGDLCCASADDPRVQRPHGAGLQCRIQQGR